ncbi:MAG: glycosyl hydrolase family 5, partial [Planctomycetota bacterium]
DQQTKVRAATTVITDTDKDFIPAGPDFVRSDTGELTRNWVKGYQMIDTDRTQAIHGWIGGESLSLKQTSFEIATPKAAVAVSSLDGQPIGRSRKVLISAFARAVPSSGGRMPMLSEPVEGRLRIAGPPGLKLIPLAGDSGRLGALNVEHSDGKYLVELPARAGTHWFMLVGDD